VLYKTDNYVRYANFTQPYLVSGLSALVQKSLLDRDGITNFEELLEKTKPLSKSQQDHEITHISLPHQYDHDGFDEHVKAIQLEHEIFSGPKSDIQLGVVNPSATYRLLTMSTHPMGVSSQTSSPTGALLRSQAKAMDQD